MSILGIQGSASSGYTSPCRKRDNSIVEGGYSNLTTGPDRVSFSEDALKMAQSRTAGSAASNEDGGLCKDKLQPDETRSVNNRGSSLTELGKNSLLSMLLENLFLAELEESAVGSGNAANGGNEQASEDAIQRQQSRTPKGAKSLEDGEKVAEIKKILTDFAKGKADLSDLPKAMAGGNGGETGQIKNAASKNEARSTASSANNGKDRLDS